MTSASAAGRGLGGDGLPLCSASLDTRDAFSFLRTPQLSVSPFPSPDVITPYDSLRA